MRIDRGRSPGVEQEKGVEVANKAFAQFSLLMERWQMMKAEFDGGENGSEVLEPSREFLDEIIACTPEEQTPEFELFCLKVQQSRIFAEELKSEVIQRIMFRASESLKEVYNPLCRKVADDAIAIAEGPHIAKIEKCRDVLETPNLSSLFEDENMQFMILLLTFSNGEAVARKVFSKTSEEIYHSVDEQERYFAVFLMNRYKPRLAITRDEARFHADFAACKRAFEEVIDDSRYRALDSFVQQLPPEKRVLYMRHINQANTSIRRAAGLAAMFASGDTFDSQLYTTFQSTDTGEPLQLGPTHRNGFFTPHDADMREVAEDMSTTVRIFAESILQNEALLVGAYKEHEHLFRRFTARGKDKFFSPASAAMMEGILSLKEVIMQLLHTTELKHIREEHGIESALDQILKDELPRRFAATVPMGLFGPLNLKGDKMTDMVEWVDEEVESKLRLSCPIRRDFKSSREEAKSLLKAPYREEFRRTRAVGHSATTDPEVAKAIDAKFGYRADQFSYTDAHHVGCPVSRQD